MGSNSRGKSLDDSLMGKTAKSIDGISSVLTEEDLKILRLQAKFPSFAKLKLPSPGQGVESCPSGYVIFYAYPFLIGLSFPLPDLIKALLIALQISPGQVVPSYWRMFKCLHERTKDWNEPLSLSEIMHCYMIRRVAPGRLNLKVKPGQPKLFTESYVNDKGWKSSFFFVKRSSLGKEGFWLREGWNSEGTYSNQSFFAKFMYLDPVLTLAFHRLGDSRLWRALSKNS